jgi:nucleotide-binding universal stress UspA family protein
MAEERPFVARRILVAIDASAASLDALAAAAALAVRLGSELRGLFVEDEDLLRLAALPFADIVRSPGGERERIDPASAEVALRAIGSRARDAFERVASRQGVTWTFQVSRGRVVREVLAAAASADLVVLGAAGHGRPMRGAVGETARAAAARAPAPVLLLARGARLGGGVVAVDDGTPAGARALAAARSLAPEGEPPTIVCPGDAAAIALVDPIARLEPALAVLPPAVHAAPGDVVERLLAIGIAVLLVR